MADFAKLKAGLTKTAESLRQQLDASLGDMKQAAESEQQHVAAHGTLSHYAAFDVTGPQVMGLHHALATVQNVVHAIDRGLGKLDEFPPMRRNPILQLLNFENESMIMQGLTDQSLSRGYLAPLRREYREDLEALYKALGGENLHADLMKRNRPESGRQRPGA